MDIEFVLLAEAGILERQALLACASLRRFGGACGSSLVTVVSPRADRRPSREAAARFEAMRAQYVEIEVENPTPELGEACKCLALASIEARPGPRTLVQLDSDTLFVAEPDRLDIATGAAARPVDGPNLCTAGPQSPLDAYWRAVCRLLDVDYDLLPSVETAIHAVHVKANYNGGLLAARRDHGVFQATAQAYRTIVAAGAWLPGRDDLRITTGAGLVEGPAARYFGLSQIAFALSCHRLDVPVELLPAGYNFPAHLLDQFDAPPPPLVHLHYHAMAGLPAADPHGLLGDRLALPDDVRAWLRAHIPL